MTEQLSADSPLIRAYRGQKSQRTPVWMMRQAGRYLPEYRALRAKHSMLELIRTPELAAEVTLQPMRRFDLDGSIIFADILNPLIGMGAELDFVEGEGPRISNPVRCAADIERLVIPDPQENVGYTLQAIKIVAGELGGRGLPLLGFSGAPFTLACYLIEGGGSRDQANALRLMRDTPDLWRNLTGKLSRMVTDYLIAQARAGAAAVQLFDSWAGVLTAEEYSRIIAPQLREIIANVKRESRVPLIYFSLGTSAMLEEIGRLGADCYGVDWRMPLPLIAERMGGRPVLQGNLDPLLLTGEWSYAEREIRRVHTEGRELQAHVFNLGHGIVPQAKIENVERMLAMLRKLDAE